jgi:hypothetical protein|uniref:BHLH domain-containing protein n=1 Tax=Picea sitchensis TaxID=3332 RepID=A9NUN3_PICSI|nr:unknown [Picea sitchensis]
MDPDFGVERQAFEAVPDSKSLVSLHSSLSCSFNTMDTIFCDESRYSQKCTGEFGEIASQNAFGGAPESIISNAGGAFFADPSFAAKYLQKSSFSPVMAKETSNADGSGSIGGPNVPILANSVQFHTPSVKNSVNARRWRNLEASHLGSEVSKFGIGSVPSALVQFPSDPGFVEQAAKFSPFNNIDRNSSENVVCGASNLPPIVGGVQQGGGENMSVFSEPTKCVDDGNGKKRRAKSLTSAENSKEPEEAKAKRCRLGESSEIDDDDNNDETSDSNSKKGKEKNSNVSQKDDNYIHVRARRGQATDSHSLAERVRREKINQRMKFLQDLVPTCNKVTGKAVMLDEIINYVQSLQHQVEFLSMKLATVNPKLDFNIDNFFAKEMSGSFSSKGMSPTYFHLDQLKQASLQTVPSPGSDIPSTMSSVDSAEMFDGTNFQRQEGWDSELQNMYNMGLLQSRLQQHQHQQRPL